MNFLDLPVWKVFICVFAAVTVVVGSVGLANRYSSDAAEGLGLIWFASIAISAFLAFVKYDLD